jgi:hypothetical protein
MNERDIWATWRLLVHDRPDRIDMTTASPAPAGPPIRSTAATAVLRFALAAMVLAAPASVHAQHASACGDDDTRQWLRFRIEPLMLSDDSRSADQLRTFHLPRVHPDSIVYIDDERLCERAAKVYYRYRLGPRPLGSVSVARVGNRYVVYGYERMGEWTSMEIYTLDFRLVASIAA